MEPKNTPEAPKAPKAPAAEKKTSEGPKVGKTGELLPGEYRTRSGAIRKDN